MSTRRDQQGRRQGCGRWAFWLGAALAAAAAAGCGRSENAPADTGSGKDPELVWSRQVVETFLNAVVRGNPYDAAGTISKEFADRLAKERQDSTVRARLMSRVYPNFSYGEADTGAAHPNVAPSPRYSGWTIQTETLAPSRDEARFTGTFSGLGDPGCEIRAAKEKDSGKWRVDSVSLLPASPGPAAEPRPSGATAREGPDTKK